MNTIKFDKKNVKMVAHRGLSGLETENTLAAFVAAGQRTYFGAECDIHCTADGKIVVIHDSDTKRVAGDSLIIEDSSFDLVRSVQLKNRNPLLPIADCPKDRADLIIPTMKEYIQVCKKYGLKCVIELKPGFTTEQSAQTVEEVKALDYLDGVIFISFDLQCLIDIRSMLPEQPIQYLVSTYSPEVREVLNKYSLDLDIRSINLTEDALAEIHADGHLVNVWTVDIPEEGEKLAAWGVDMITSNILE